MSKDAYLDKMVTTFVGIITNYFSQALVEVVTSTVNAISATEKRDPKFQVKQRKAVEAMGNLMDLSVDATMHELQEDLTTVMAQVEKHPAISQMRSYLASLNERLGKHGFDVNLDKGDNGFMYGILDAIMLGKFDEKELNTRSEKCLTKNGAPRPMQAVIMDELLARIFPAPEEPAAQEPAITLDDFLKGKGVKFA